MPNRGDGSPPATVEIVSEPARVTALEPEWRRLAVDQGNAFVTPDWFAAWRGREGGGERPAVGVARDGAGGLAGVLPLIETGTGRRRALGFAGARFGDHFAPVADGDPAPFLRALGPRLRERGRSVRLEKIDDGAPWAAELARSAGFGTPIPYRAAGLPTLRIGGRTWEEFLAGRSRNFRSQLGRKRRALERDHRPEFRWSAGESEVREDMATLFRLHDLRWDERTGETSLDSPIIRRFLEQFAVAAERNGWLRLCTLTVDEAPAASWLGWNIGGRFAYYQAGFDPARASHSVGLLILAEAVRRAFDEGADEFDLLLGDEAFKSRFADSERQVTSLLLAPRLGADRLAAGLGGLARRGLRRLPEDQRRRIGAAKKRLTRRS
ncbi:GNAT family N-acetyltransferase [Thermoleophilia bacterium SCSIO 60948]|nr:GNAT family N-acetyltransferase [Thermoleophilia bacterium SCSIO 60948]